MNENTVNLIKEFILASNTEEIEIEEFVKISNSDNRKDIINVLKQLEKDNLGVLAIGRRGHKTRFIKDAIREKTTIPESLVNDIKQIINLMKNNEEFIVEKNGNLVYDNEIVYSFTNRVALIECIKQFNNLGKFITGRRGHKSRFIKIDENDNVVESEVLDSNESNEFAVKYNVVSQ